MKRRNLKIKPEHKKRIFKLSDQLLVLMVDPTSSVDTEMVVQYLKSKIKK